MARKRQRQATQIETLKHKGDKRKNIATAELERFMREDEAAPTTVEYSRRHNPGQEPEMYARNPDFDPQLVWKGKEDEDREPLRVAAVPIYIQEKIHPKAIIDDLKRRSSKAAEALTDAPDLFADFNDLPNENMKLDFYAHDQNWTNRMILGDSLPVMASLAEKEGLREQVQCIYIDPPYGINFSSNWQP